VPPKALATVKKEVGSTGEQPKEIAAETDDENTENFQRAVRLIFRKLMKVRI